MNGSGANGADDGEREAARLLCVGFAGDDPAAADVAALAALGPGGLILFARNVSTPERTRALVDRLAEAIAASTGRRPYVGIDQEGGRVARLRTGAAAVPSAMAIGAANDESLAEAAGRALAADVRRFGGDVDFAPVLDLALRAESRAVGTRAFGDEPERVAALGLAVARGLAAGGVAAVAKHAPGHGDTGADSHDAVPTLAASPARLAARDLVPFARASAAGVPAAMLAHVVVPAFGAVPASANAAAVRFVRAALGDTILLMTDCLEMGAIAEGPETLGTAEAAARAIAAGVDVAIVSHDPERQRAAARAIARDVRSGAISRERFAAARAAVDRFRATAARLAREAGPIDDVATGEATALAIARAAIAELRGPARPVVFTAGDAVSIVSFERAASASAEGQGLAAGTPASEGSPSLALALRRRRLRAEMMRVPVAPAEADVEALELVLGAQGARPLAILARGARHSAAQAAAIARLVALQPDAVVVCAGEPFDVAVLGAARTVLCTFGDGPAEIEALADVLTGRACARGIVPVRLASATP